MDSSVISKCADQYFPGGYRAHRDAFLEACRRIGAEVHSHAYEDLCAPDGGVLSCDVAIVGRPDAPLRLVLQSGLHGLEAPSGSAVQTAWLESGAPALLSNSVCVILIHAINPYGFAYHRRNDDANIDPNRNFPVPGKQPVSNPNYAEISSILTPEVWSDRTLPEIFEALNNIAAQKGMDWLVEAVVAGQFEDPSGLFFGGTRASWPTRTLKAILERHVQGAKAIGYIDFHTGLGAMGEAVFLCFHEEGARARERARDWFGTSVIDPDSKSDGQSEHYYGVSYDGIEAMLGADRSTIVCVEFGTVNSNQVLGALIREHWLHRSSLKHVDKDGLAFVINTFSPDDEGWRKSVVERGCAIVAQAVDGLVRCPF